MPSDEAHSTAFQADQAIHCEVGDCDYCSSFLRYHEIHLKLLNTTFLSHLFKKSLLFVLFLLYIKDTLLFIFVSFFFVFVLKAHKNELQKINFV